MKDYSPGAEKLQRARWMKQNIPFKKPGADPVATAQELVNSFEELKTIPQIALRVCQLISTENSTIQEIEALIRLDPVLVARLLRMANSAYFGTRQGIESISKAIVLLGLNNLRNLVIIDAIKGMLPRDTDTSVFSRQRLWMHCTAVGVCARMISRRIFGTKGEDAFLAGVLHDIGVILEDQTREKLFRTVIEHYRAGQDSILDYERQILGTDHCTIGGLLVTKWGFPDEVRQGIVSHHTVIENEADLHSIPTILQIAHYIADSTGYAKCAERVESPRGMVADHISSQIEEYRVLASDFLEEMEKAVCLFEVE